jgi:hypothetical protein
VLEGYWVPNLINNEYNINPRITSLRQCLDNTKKRAAKIEAMLVKRDKIGNNK